MTGAGFKAKMNKSKMKKKPKAKAAISVTFVGNDDVMEHIMEEVNETKARKDKVHTLAPSVATPTTTTPSRPLRTSRKRVNYSDAAMSKKTEIDDDDEDEEETDEEGEGSEMEDEDRLDHISEVLLDRDGPLGTEVYSFKTNKRTGKMAQIAAQSIDRQQTKKAAVKRKMRRNIARDKDDSDFSSGQSSDDDNDDDEDYDDEKDDLNSDTSSERSITMKRPKRTSIATSMTTKKEQATPKGRGSRGASAAASAKKGRQEVGKAATPGRRSNRRSAKEDVAPLQSNMAEEYFVAHVGQAVTSDHTLSRLENPQMASGQLAEALESAPNSCSKEMRELFQEHCALFNKWMYHLSNDCNILLYGLGSKRRLLEEFRCQQLSDYSSIVVNGYFPSLTVKSILNAISDDVIDDVCNHRNMADQLEFIEDKLEEMDEPLFIIIHNLDGSMLRGSKVQSVLSKIAQISNVHILASIDHINAPLIWDQERSSTFRWLWYDVTTFDPYADETSYENSLLVQQSGMLALSSLTHVLRSLTPNARGIFNMLVEFQLEHKDDGTYNGMSFQEMYQKCREAFLVNSDLTLRAQLTEFRDHKLIRSKKSLDGMELLSIPLDNSTLLEFQQQEEL